MDPTTESWYAPSVAQLAAMHTKAEAAFRAGNRKEAASILTESQSLQNRLLAAPQPTLAAMTAASDLDDLYGRMLMADGRYGYARLQFQKNFTRWKSWKPQTADAALRAERARAAIAQCDRRLAE